MFDAPKPLAVVKTSWRKIWRHQIMTSSWMRDIRIFSFWVRLTQVPASILGEVSVGMWLICVHIQNIASSCAFRCHFDNADLNSSMSIGWIKFWEKRDFVRRFYCKRPQSLKFSCLLLRVESFLRVAMIGADGSIFVEYKNAKKHFFIFWPFFAIKVTFLLLTKWNLGGSSTQID